MPRFATLDSIRKDQEGDNQSNEYYAGGANNHGGGSGISVVGRDDANKDLVGGIFNKAKSQANNSNPPDQSGSENVIPITFYRNGFTVGDGPFRPRNVEENEKFLNTMENGFCPPELVVNGKPSNVSLKDMRDQDYVEPFRAFGGEGAQLGASSSNNDTWTIEKGTLGLVPNVDTSLPTVKVRISYADKRKNDVATLNESHTVGDLIGIIDNSGNVSGHYQLLSSVRGPPKPLTLDALHRTIKEAGLAGCVVTVRMV